MFENIINFFKKLGKKDENMANKDTAKERLHLVLMQDRANVSADFLDMMKQEIIEVIKKYIDVDENEIDVKLTNKQNSDGTTGAPALYANIPIVSIKDEARKLDNKFALNENKKDDESKDDNENKNEKSEDNIEEGKKEENSGNNNSNDDNASKSEDNGSKVEEVNAEESSKDNKVEEKAENSQKKNKKK